MAVAFATVFLRGLFSVVTVYNAESCKSEKPRNNFPKLKTGEHCKSILSGVEVAGFEPAAFWSRTKRATKLRYTSTLEPMRGLEPLTC